MKLLGFNKYKNLTPRHISIMCAGTSSLFLLLCLVILQNLGLIAFPIPYLIIIPILLFIIIYFLCVFLIDKFIYRRIKLIYKIIHHNKVSLSKDKVTMPRFHTDLMDTVEISVTKWVENQQATIERLRSLEEYRRNFLGDVSHELKTPIFNIQGYLYTLIDGAKDNPELIDKYLDRAAKNTDRLQKVVEDLESISKLELGNLVLHESKFDIQKLTETVFEEQELLAAEHNIKLSFKDGASAGYQVVADKHYIHIVLGNLISNSIKYGIDNGFTKVAFYDMDDYILIEVADNGIGIDKHDLVHIFDRFYRVDKSRSRKVGGSGLGLSIVKHIIEAHNQTVSVRSTINKGSTFSFTLKKFKK